ncbi:MAG: DUF2087 domain-containing protein [Burkholderiales bacterium]
MHSAEEQVASEPGCIARLGQLAVRQGLAMGVLATGSARDFALVLAAAGCAFPEAETWSEREVNDRLRAFLAGPGAMLAVDHVELRRWLVDTGVLARDGFGRAYALGTPRAEIADAMRELRGHDLAALVLGARARDAERRAARKQAWQGKAQDAA